MILIKELIDVVKEFYSMRKKEIFLINIVPFIIGVIAYTSSYIFTTNNIIITDFASNFVDSVITILALFISFSMAYITLLIASNSENVNILKNKESKHYSLNKEPCNVFQTMHNLMSYSVLIEITFLVLSVVEKYFIYVLESQYLKIVLALDIAILIHIVILIMIQIRDMYFAFWK